MRPHYYGTVRRLAISRSFLKLLGWNLVYLYKNERRRRWLGPFWAKIFFSGAVVQKSNFANMVPKVPNSQICFSYERWLKIRGNIGVSLWKFFCYSWRNTKKVGSKNGLIFETFSLLAKCQVETQKPDTVASGRCKSAVVQHTALPTNSGSNFCSCNKSCWRGAWLTSKTVGTSDAYPNGESSFATGRSRKQL